MFGRGLVGAWACFAAVGLLACVIHEDAPKTLPTSSTHADDPARPLRPPPDNKGTPDAAVEGPPAVSYVGRFDASDPNGVKMGWPGGRIVARFSGTEVRARLDETKIHATGPSQYDVRIDGKWTSLLKPKEGAGEYVLARDLSDGEHVVELVRRSEGQIAVTQFRGFDFPNGRLLAPPARPKRRIELLGDSNTAAYGVEGTAATCPFSADTQNFNRGWGALVGEDLGADVIGIAYSGKGILQNNNRNDKTVIADLFVRALPEQAQPLWAFETAPAPDVAVIMLGGNDYSQPNQGVFDAPDAGAFKAKYAELVALVRAKYPAAHLFSALSPTQKDDYPVGYNARTSQAKAFTQVVEELKANGDAKAYFLDVLPVATQDERTGCDYHPSAKLQRRIADFMTAAIKSKTGW